MRSEAGISLLAFQSKSRSSNCLLYMAIGQISGTPVNTPKASKKDCSWVVTGEHPKQKKSKRYIRFWPIAIFTSCLPSKLPLYQTSIYLSSGELRSTLSEWDASWSALLPPAKLLGMLHSNSRSAIFFDVYRYHLIGFFSGFLASNPVLRCSQGDGSDPTGLKPSPGRLPLTHPPETSQRSGAPDKGRLSTMRSGKDNTKTTHYHS